MVKNKFLVTILSFKEKLFFTALGILKDKEESEDAVQEVYIKLWKVKNKVEKYDNLEVYSLRVLKNHCFDKLRKRKYKSNTKMENIVIETNTPENIYEYKEMANNLKAIIDNLKGLEGIVTKLRHYQNKSISEIAELLELTPNHTRVALSRARNKIKEELYKIVPDGKF